MPRRDEYEDDERRGPFQDGRGPGRENLLKLSPNEFAFTRDTKEGALGVHVGAAVFSPTAQDEPVRWRMKADPPFQVVSLADAIQQAPIAVEGYYMVLLNPAKGGAPGESPEELQPKQGRNDRIPGLDVGRKVNIPGPCHFPLWPGQHVTVLKGHHLRSNQYLQVRIYNEDEARKNWSKAVIKTVEGDESPDIITGKVPADITVGKQYVIKGTEVSFYMPPTGVSVVPDSEGGHVREALTLERLEYCILVSENGSKRYERGPQVVFPEPTEVFIKGPKGEKKFRAIELSEIQGIYVKVIADYEDTPDSDHPDGKFGAGEELFITGKDSAIYFPREEHSLVKYDGKSKHYATAIPSGEGRYVLDRLTGKIDVVKGYIMSLPDPRFQVFVHRVLSDRECILWYPNPDSPSGGNEEVLAYNRSVRALQAHAATTRGAISSGDIARSMKKGRKRVVSEEKTRGGVMLNDVADALSGGMEEAQYASAAQSFVADEFSRASTYTQPRSITLDTKFQGVPVLKVFTGYAILVVDAIGTRRVVEGPERVLLGYDETLEILSLSTGKPKNTDNPLETVYLRTKNNKVSDKVAVETADHVVVDMKLAFRVDFEGDKSKWFEVENYVKLMTDHVRSVLMGAVKQVPIAEFYLNAVPFVRDTILGVKSEDGSERTGMPFKENGMRILDVEVLNVAIRDPRIAELLLKQQLEVVNNNIELERERRKLDFTQEHQLIQRKIAIENFETVAHNHKLEVQSAESGLQVILAKLANEVQQHVERRKVVEVESDNAQFAHDSILARDKKDADQRLEIEAAEQEKRIELLVAQTDAALKQLDKFAPEFSAAITTLSNNETARSISEAFNAMSLLGGRDFAEVISRATSAFPKLAEFLQTRGAAGNGNGTPDKEKPATTRRPRA